MIQPNTLNYKLKRQRYDIRDLKYHLTYKMKISNNLPITISLNEIVKIPILNQKDLGACTANATSNAILFYLKKNQKKEYQPSRLYIYYFSRLLENTINEDSGCTIRNVLKAINLYGACDEFLYPYKIKKYKNKPPYECIKNAKQNIKHIEYISISQNLNIIKNCIYQQHLIIFGIEIYDSFKNDCTLQNGNVPMPNINLENYLGLHCILLIGYDDKQKIFICQNSWGSDVGRNGLFNIPYNYILSNRLAADFWIINIIN
jgi:C1A family cysteine protease